MVIHYKAKVTEQCRGLCNQNRLGTCLMQAQRVVKRRGWVPVTSPKSCLLRGTPHWGRNLAGLLRRLGESAGESSVLTANATQIPWASARVCMLW
jgi:hypothetical protein